MFHAIRTLAIALVLFGACDATNLERDGSPPELRGGSWRRLLDAPLPPRHSAHAFSIEGRVLVLGGTTAQPCPANAGCAPPSIPPLRDGAAFDVARDRWSRIADAPVALGLTSGAALGETLYLWAPGSERGPAGETLPGVRSAFLSYRPADDTWRELPAPPGEVDDLRLVAAGDRVIAFRATQERGVLPDLAFDPIVESWTELPRDPLTASFDRAMVWTGDELVLIGLENVPNPGSDRPSLYRAASFDVDSNTWRRLPDSEIAAWGPDWFWVGGRIVNPYVGATEDERGRSYPWGGMLDPVSRRWSSLPDGIAMGSYDGPTLGGSTIAFAAGRALDVPGGSWLPLDGPPMGPDDGEAAVMAGDRLFVFGGYVIAESANLRSGTLLRDVWMWQPLR